MRMQRLLLIPLLLMPLSVGAAVASGTASTTETNAYIAQSEVRITNPLPSDLITAGGSVNVTAPVGGDILAAGGTLNVLQGAGGDVRVAAGKVTVSGIVGGDVAAAGGTVRVIGSARNIYAAGGSVDVEGSASGDVTLYGANVFLSGEYTGNVTIIASNRFALGENTLIHGTLKYSAPEELVISPGTVIEGGVKYTGAYSYVPTNQQVHQYALIGAILFFAVRVLAGIIVAGLLVGLFPTFAERVSSMVLRRDPYALGKILLVGVAIAVLTPVLCLLLLVSFVGVELALLLVVLYILLAVLAYAFCGIVVGAFLRRTLLYKIRGEYELTWQDAALGTAFVHAIVLLPLVGTVALFILTLACAGALAVVAYRTAFSINT